MIQLKCQQRSPFQIHCDMVGGCQITGDDVFWGEKNINLGNVEATVSQRAASSFRKMT